MRGKPCALVSFLPGLSVRRPCVAHCREAGREPGAAAPGGRGFALRAPTTWARQRWAPMFATLRGDAEGLKPGLAAVIEGDLAAGRGLAARACRKA